MMERHGHRGPSAMAGLFSRMPLHDRELFLIKRLEVVGEGNGLPSPPIRSAIHCFIFITKGEALASIGGESYLFQENDCAIIPAGQIFSVRYYSRCAGFMGGFHTDFLNTDTEGSSLLRTFGFLRKWGNHKVHFEPGHGVYILNIFERLCAEAGQVKNKYIQKAYLMTLLVELDAIYRQPEEMPETVNIDNELCNRFVEAVFNHPDMGMTIACYADRLNVTPAHLHKVVKRCTGKTPLAWINEAVTLEAKALLCHTDKPVNDVASVVGVADPSYFSRFFKRQTGLAPLAYRNEMKNT